MNTTDIRSVVLDVLGEIAPEAAGMAIDDVAPLREQFDLDSMDFLNFMIGLHGQLHVDIPETDYPKVQALKDLIAYLSMKLESASQREGGPNVAEQDHSDAH